MILIKAFTTLHGIRKRSKEKFSTSVSVPKDILDKDLHHIKESKISKKNKKENQFESEKDSNKSVATTTTTTTKESHNNMTESKSNSMMFPMLNSSVTRYAV